MTPLSETREIEGLECTSRGLRAAIRCIATVRVLLVPAQRAADGVKDVESDRNPDDDEPESHQLPRQPFNRVHAQILRAETGHDRGHERVHE